MLIEGPPEADKLVELGGRTRTCAPPVALLAYPQHGDPAARAAFWPFGDFSPEWQAIRWALEAKVPVRFCDLPAGVRFASQEVRQSGRPRGRARRARRRPGRPSAADPDALARRDPIGALAVAAGYDDPERWWEDVVEHQIVEPTHDPMAPFEAIAAAMGVVRQAAPDPPAREKLYEDRREAHMRQVLRTARKTHERIAVVCGAWHVPALTDPLPPAAADARVAQGPGEDPHRHDLGAVDARAARVVAGLRRRRLARPAGTTTCSPRPTGWSSGG